MELWRGTNHTLQECPKPKKDAQRITESELRFKEATKTRKVSQPEHAQTPTGKFAPPTADELAATAPRTSPKRTIDGKLHVYAKSKQRWFPKRVRDGPPPVVGLATTDTSTVTAATVAVPAVENPTTEPAPAPPGAGTPADARFNLAMANFQRTQASTFAAFAAALWDGS